MADMKTFCIDGSCFSVPEADNFYTKAETDAIIAALNTGKFDVVDALPATGEDKVIYLVPNGGSGDNSYDEYIWTGDAFEKIGTTEIDLSGYYTSAQTDTLLAEKQNTLTAGTNITLENDVISATEYTAGDNVTIENDVISAVDTTYGQATDTDLGLVKINPDAGVNLNEDGQLAISGQWGEFETNGMYSPKDRQPREVGAYSVLVTDALGIEMHANRSLAIVSGAAINVRPAEPGTTVYYAENTYLNRIIAKVGEFGTVSRDEETSTVEMTIKVVSVLINGQTFVPDSSPDDPDNPIVITLEETANPDTTITQLRMFGTMTSYATAHIGNGVRSGPGSGGRSLILGGLLTKLTGNDACMVGYQMYCDGNGNAMFGRNHIAKKNRAFLAGTGHDTSNARTEAPAAFGEWSLLDPSTLLAVGNGVSATERSNAFEVSTRYGGTAEVNNLMANNARLEFKTEADITPVISTTYWSLSNGGSIVDYDGTPGFATPDVKGKTVNISLKSAYVIPVKEGETIQWSFSARKKTGSETGSLRLILMKTDGSGGSQVLNVVHDGTAASYSTEWTTYSGTFTVPSGMEYMLARFTRTNVGAGSDGGYEIKDFSLIQSVDSGIFLTSPNGTKFQLTVDDSGNLGTVAV